MAKASTSFNFGANKGKKVRDVFNTKSKPKKGKGGGAKGGGS